MANVVKKFEQVDPTVVGEIVTGEMAKQIETAKRFPRDPDKGLRELTSLAVRTDATAEACMYSLKRTGKDGIVFITGASVRFAELLAYSWGNLRWGARIIEVGAEAVVAQGLCYDLERNTGGLVEIRRGILTSTGNRFGADMINVTSNAACSIATRNAIFDVVPQVLWSDVYEQVKEKAIGAAKIPERIQQAVRFFVDKGAKQDDILKAMGVKAIKDMTRDHLEIFIGLRTALKEGAIHAEKIFTAEGAEQRAKLRLISEEEEHFGGIDKQIQGKAAAPDAPAAKKSSAKAQRAARAVGDPDGSPHSGGDDPAKANAAETTKAATPKADAGSDAPSKDETRLADIELAVKEARGGGKRQHIVDARQFLEQLEKDAGPLATRAHTLLNKFELD